MERGAMMAALATVIEDRCVRVFVCLCVCFGKEVGGEKTYFRS